MAEIKDPENTIILETTKGKVVIQLLPQVAPEHARRNHPVHRFSGILVKQIARKKLQAANRKRYCQELMQVIRKVIAERPLRRFPGGNGRGMGERRPRTAVG